MGCGELIGSLYVVAMYHLQGAMPAVAPPVLVLDDDGRLAGVPAGRVVVDTHWD